MTTNFKQSSSYELADALQETEPYYSTDYKLFDNAATMLRQQADRIAELEEENRQIRERTWDSDFSRQFLKEIAEAKERHGIK